MEDYIKLNEHQSVLLIGLDIYEASSMFKLFEFYRHVNSLQELYTHIKTSRTIRDVIIVPVVENEKILYIIQKVI